MFDVGAFITEPVEPEQIPGKVIADQQVFEVTPHFPVPTGITSEVGSDKDSFEDDDLLPVSPSEEHGIMSGIVHGLDIGNLEGYPKRNKLEEFVRVGHIAHPKHFPDDITGRKFPTSLLSVKQQHGEITFRSWIVFSHVKKALFCFHVDCSFTQLSILHNLL